MGSLVEKIDRCHNNSENSSITRINKHAVYGYLWFTHCSFDATKHSMISMYYHYHYYYYYYYYYRGRNCMETFFKSLERPFDKDYSGEAIKLLPFYNPDFLFTEL